MAGFFQPELSGLKKIRSRKFHGRIFLDFFTGKISEKKFFVRLLQKNFQKSQANTLTVS
jgi:hypothetical protein